MPLWWCQWEDCRKPAAQRAGDCLLCDEHLCRLHLQQPWHQCPTPEDDWKSYSAQHKAAETRDVKELSRRIDTYQLCVRAFILRGGINCSVDKSPESLAAMMGNQNCHAVITFSDGVKWLARFRLVRTSSPPQEVRDCIIRSEAATISYLKQHTRIPVPQVFDWACESDPSNLVGAGFILMELLPGKSLACSAATPSQKEKVMQQLVDIFLEIEKHPFKKMGSLISPAGNDAKFDVQGLAHPATYRMGGRGPIGPFSSSLEGSRAILESYLAKIANGEIDACHTVDVYLAHRFRLDIANDLWKDVPSEGQFFLKHPDDKGDHILVNDSFDIVGVIDWEWAQTCSKAEAFSSPCMMWPVGKFYHGSNELAADELRLADIYRERGREDLAKYVIEGRKVQRFLFAQGTFCTFLDQQTLANFFTGLSRAFGSQGGDEEWGKWKAMALEKWKSDELLQGLLKLEQSEEEKV